MTETTAELVAAPDWNAERVYLDQVAPLLKEIAVVCQRNEIPMLASFQTAPGVFWTAQVLPEPRTDRRLLAALQKLDKGTVTVSTQAPRL